MKRVQFSAHCVHDRIERISQIGACIGFGEVVLTVPYETKREQLTDTGVCIVLDKEQDFVITMFPANLSKAQSMYKIVTGDGTMPTALFNTIKYNMRKYQSIFY